jgi:hypothetical protein
VVDVGCSHGELRGGEERRRARSEEAGFTDHEVIVAVSCRTGPLRSVTPQTKTCLRGPRFARPLRGGCTGLGGMRAWGLALLGGDCA